jgi:hypothetical protein
VGAKPLPCGMFHRQCEYPAGAFIAVGAPPPARIAARTPLLQVVLEAVEIAAGTPLPQVVLEMVRIVAGVAFQQDKFKYIADAPD